MHRGVISLQPCSLAHFRSRNHIWSISKGDLKDPIYLSFKTINTYILCPKIIHFEICPLCVKLTFVYKAIYCSIVCNDKALVYKSAVNPKYGQQSCGVWVVILRVLPSRVDQILTHCPFYLLGLVLNEVLRLGRTCGWFLLRTLQGMS